MFSPVQTYRLARWLYVRQVPVLPGFLDRIGLLVFRCVIPHQAEIGTGFTVGYSGFGIVVHKDAKIGRNVFLAHDVTLGGRGGPGRGGAPKIGDDVYVAAGARILGDVVVGAGSVIGANAVVIHSVPPRCAVAGVPARVIREDIEVRDYI